MAKTIEAPDAIAAGRTGKDERRAMILSVAFEMFLANGYAGTSMSAIAGKLGGSKGTLYNYFPSKEELFDAVIERKCEQFLSILYEAELEGIDLRQTLIRFGERFLEVALADDSVAIYRLVTAECARFPEIGAAFYNAGPRRGLARMGEFLEHAKSAGQLRADADIALAAEQFFSLCLHYVHQRRLWGVSSVLSDAERRTHVEGAVSTLMRAFGT